MANVKYDISRVPRELLEAYACYQLCMRPDRRDPIDATSDVGKCVVKAAEVPLRTKAEIDHDLAKAVRDYVKEYSDFDGVRIPLMEMKFKGCFGDPSHRTLPEVLIALLSEETVD